MEKEERVLGVLAAIEKAAALARDGMYANVRFQQPMDVDDALRLKAVTDLAVRLEAVASS
jgi:hypothetical protein